MVRIEYIDWDCLLSEGRLTRVLCWRSNFMCAYFPLMETAADLFIRGRVKNPSAGGV